MTEPSLLQACLGMDDIAVAVQALDREELEQLAANALALARLCSRPDYGVYARRMVNTAIAKLVDTSRPLGVEMLGLVRAAL